MRIMWSASCAIALLVYLAPPVQAAKLEDQAVEIGPGITPPKTGGPVFLQTPEGVADANARAALNVRLLLDKTGRVQRAEALDTPDPRLAAAAVDLLKKMTFAPAQRDNKPVVVWCYKTVLFRPRPGQVQEAAASGCVPDPYELNQVGELPTDAEPARLVERPDAVFPPELMQQRVNGLVQFACIVDTCGLVRDCRVLEASRPEFARAGMDAVSRRRYEPARRNGTPVTSNITIKLTFKIATR
jgi:TonB family protein